MIADAGDGAARPGLRAAHVFRFVAVAARAVVPDLLQQALQIPLLLLVPGLMLIVHARGRGIPGHGISWGSLSARCSDAADLPAAAAAVSSRSSATPTGRSETTSARTLPTRRRHCDDFDHQDSRDQPFAFSPRPRRGRRSCWLSSSLRALLSGCRCSSTSTTDAREGNRISLVPIVPEPRCHRRSKRHGAGAQLFGLHARDHAVEGARPDATIDALAKLIECSPKDRKRFKSCWRIEEFRICRSARD